VTTTSENSFNRLESNHNAINHPSPNVEHIGPISLLARQRQYQFITLQAQGQNLRMYTETMDADKSKEQIS
jgi:hypothetical protein